MDIQAASEFETSIQSALDRGDIAGASAIALSYRREAGAAIDDRSPLQCPGFRARWFAAQVALAAGRLREALERVETLERLAEGHSPSLACRIALAAAEAEARLGWRDRARESLARARSRGLEANVLRDPRARLAAIRVGLELDDLSPDGPEVSACEAALAGDPGRLALLRDDLARARERSGRVDAADHVRRLALSEIGPGDRSPVSASLHVGLGRSSHRRGDFQAALDHFDAALEAAGPGSDAAAEVLIRRALVWRDLGRPDRSRREADRAAQGNGLADRGEEFRALAGQLGLLAPDEASSSRVDEDEWLAFRAAEFDPGSALTLYRKALGATTDPVRRARRALAVAQLELEIPGGESDPALLDEAERLARSHDLPEILWRALEARGRMVQREGRDQEARSSFEEAMVLSAGRLGRLRRATEAGSYDLHRTGLTRLLLRGAFARRDAEAACRYQEIERGQALLRLRAAAERRSGRPPRAERRALDELDLRIAELDRRIVDDPTPERLRERVRLSSERDHLLEARLGSRTERAPGTAEHPGLTDLSGLAGALPAGTVYLAPALIADDLFALVVRRGQAGRIVHLTGANEVREDVKGFHQALGKALDAYYAGRPRRDERDLLDGALDRLGAGPLGALLDSTLGPGDRMLWIPDESLLGVPIHAVRRSGRYAIEAHEVVFGLGASWVAGASSPRSWRPPWAPSMVVTESSSELPEAEREGEAVRAAWTRSRWWHGADATPVALDGQLGRARSVHVACHGEFDAEHPLAAAIVLPGGERWRPLDWVDDRVSGLPLAVFGSCRTAQARPALGREPFGLAAGALAVGVRAVIAGLWSMPDQGLAAFWARFYHHRMTEDLAAALARTQREALALDDASPLSWAAFALHGDPGALGPTSFPLRWWSRLRQRRYARRFPEFFPATRGRERTAR